MSQPEVVVVRHDPCAWLPAGGRADVVLSTHPAPEPTAVVRLLVTSGEDVWVVARSDGGGLDLPTARVTQDVATALDALLAIAPDGTTGLRPLGFVRNSVLDPPAGAAAAGREPQDSEGRWLGSAVAADALGERHWWPLHREAAPGSVRSGA